MSEESGRRTTTLQMSLGLFEEMSGQPINESTREIGFQRNNVFVAINGLGLSSRRFIDAAYFIAAQEPAPRDTYDVDLNYFKWLMRYESRNVRHLQSVIKEAQRVLIEVTDTPPDRAPSEDDQWISEQLMGSVKIGKGRIQFRVPPLMLRHITGPDKHHWLNLCITASFSQTYARAIYDYVLPYVAAGLTDWIELDVMRRWPGKLGTSASEFKHFRPKYLDPAVRQINELSDIDLSYETRADSETSRKINKIRFRMKRKDTVAALLSRQPDAHDLLLTLKEEFGLSNKQFDVIAEHRMSWTDERIQQAIEYTRFRLNQGKVTKSPAGYLMKALSHNWQVSEAERKMVAIQSELAVAVTAQETARTVATTAVKQSIAARDEEARSQRNEEVKQGREHFESADEKTRKELVRLYIASQAGKLMLRRLKLEAGALSDANILNHSDLSWYFGQFVYGKMKQLAVQ